MSAVVEIRPGSSMLFDGSVWTIDAITGGQVTLRSGDLARAVPLSILAARAATLGSETDPGDVAEMSSVRLSSMTAEQAKTVRERAEVVRSVLEGSGPGTQRRLEAKAREIGVSPRTLSRWVAAYRSHGEAGLATSRVVGTYAPRSDPRWDATCLEVLDEFTMSSTPSMAAVLDRVTLRLAEKYGPETVPEASRAARYKRLKELDKGRHTFGSAKGRRSVAHRPKGAYGRLRATRPGEYLVLDTTPLDVFAMEPTTLRWVPVELTVAIDLYTRCVLGVRLSPVSTRSSDVASVLRECVLPGEEAQDVDRWAYHGVPRNVLVGTEEPDGTSQEREGGLPRCLPEAIVVDRGRVYMSAHVIGACARLGISVQPAIPYKPTDKPVVERFFRTLREGLLQHLPGYKGPDVYSRGADVEKEAFYYISELEEIIRGWVGSVYHRTKHSGLCVPEQPGLDLSPLEMFEVGIARAGGLWLPGHPDLAFEFLDVEWRDIHHYGVEVRGRRYDGSALNPYRASKSPYTGARAGKWPLFVDAGDVRTVYFKDPESRVWNPLVWEHAAALDGPFSQDAAEYTKRLALRTGRHVPAAQAVRDLLEDWSKGTVTTRRERSVALRLAAERSRLATGTTTSSDEEPVSLPALVSNLDTYRRQRPSSTLVDDLDVFEWYRQEYGDDAEYEVLE
jgi:transposase InsO family protein